MLNLSGQAIQLFSDSASQFWSGVNAKTLKLDVINGKSSYIVEGIKKNYSYPALNIVIFSLEITSESIRI